MRKDKKMVMNYRQAAKVNSEKLTNTVASSHFSLLFLQTRIELGMKLRPVAY